MNNFIKILIFADYMSKKSISDKARDHCQLPGK